MKISGHGGFGVLEDDGGNKRFETGQVDLDVEDVLDDVTDSGSNGEVEGLPVGLTKVNSLTFEVVDRDDANFILVLGITEGERVTLWVKRGAAATFHKVTGTLVRNVRETNPQDRARRVVVTCEYGKLTRNVTAPTFT